MPQDPARDSDTVRLHPDGTVSSGRPTPPPAAVSPPRATEPTEPRAAETPAGSADPAEVVAPPAADETVSWSATPPVEAPPSATPVAEEGTAADDTTAESGSAAGTSSAGDSPGSDPGESTSLLPVDPGTPGAGDDTATPPPPVDGDGDGPEGPPAGDAGSGRPWWRRTAVLAPVAAVAVLGAAYGIDLAVSSGDVPRSTVVGGVDIGGLSPAAAATRLEEELGPRVSADHPVLAGDVEGVVHPPAAGITLDVPATVDAADDQPLNPWTRLSTLFADRTVTPVLTGDETALTAQVDQLAATVDQPPVEATVVIEGTSPRLVEAADGRRLDRDGAAEAITAALASGGDPTRAIELPVDVDPATVPDAEAQRVLDETVTPALAAPVRVVGADGADSAEIPVAAIAASLTFTPQEDGTLAVAVDPQALKSQMGEQFAVFGSPAEDARFEVSGDSIAVVPSVDGEGINPTDLAQQLLPVLTQAAPREVTAVLGPVPAEFTTEQAQALGIEEQVSSFSTNFTNTASGTNIRVVAAEVDGALVLPGETFSLNGYTGPRGTAQGYVPAAVISGGELSQAVGGGISQFATTMFNAVFFAGLEDVYHKPHSFYISRYPAGREATVYEGQIDLQWRNDTDTGIYVQTEWVPGSITVTFWGTRYYDIESISSDRRNLRAPAQQEKIDDGNCTPQSGSTGFDITVTRVFQDLNTGAELRREAFDTRYAAEAIIRCVPPPAEPAPGDPAASGAPTPTPTPTPPGG
ncbi:VanW family protein [Modestobacter roseus]|uniref:Vancomycin resistance protein YoaR n=1 Tax=Modestobacter roseus TaxID=1181884 RepID=A0A562IRL6_9ACTN|nr:VanW family protein [Modestobacter roseus]MQA31979.1 vanomycin resistance protein VanB [Modestobacter roseus]TWH73490.1 vancomycin resistance protein YoaR [Modestobacter roseus]